MTETTAEGSAATGRPLSVSQKKQYERCPQAYYLQRVEKAWERPAAWLPQGLAVHEAAEAYEKSGREMAAEDMDEVYRESYVKHTNRLAADTPNFEYWFRSGPYAGERDIERRFGIGLEQTARYREWYAKHPNEVIWIAPDGTPAIELGFDITLDGTRVRGFIDAVIRDEKTGKVTVRDNKTGASPGDDFQLGTYAVALAEQYDIEAPNTGDYWMGKSGKPTIAYHLDDWGRDRITAEFKELEENLNAERFDPDPEPSKCRFCNVSAACQFAQ